METVMEVPARRLITTMKSVAALAGTLALRVVDARRPEVFPEVVEPSRHDGLMEPAPAASEVRSRKPVAHHDERRAAARQPHVGIIEIGRQMAFAHDISSTGVSFYVRWPLAVDDVIEMAAGGSLGEPDVIRAHARVVRVDEDGRGFLVGARFLDSVDIAARPATSSEKAPRRRRVTHRTDLDAPAFTRTLS